MPDTTRIIYSLQGVGKTYGDRTVLKDIYLSFYYGAKIGVLGLNGSGKSTLLRIMAGLDTEHEGAIEASQGYSIGLLPQEPVLDNALTVEAVVRQGMKPTLDLLAEFDKVNDKLAEPMSDDEMT